MARKLLFIALLLGAIVVVKGCSSGGGSSAPLGSVTVSGASS